MTQTTRIGNWAIPGKETAADAVDGRDGRRGGWCDFGVDGFPSAGYFLIGESLDCYGAPVDVVAEVFRRAGWKVEPPKGKL